MEKKKKRGHLFLPKKKDILWVQDGRGATGITAYNKEYLKPMIRINRWNGHRNDDLYYFHGRESVFYGYTDFVKGEQLAELFNCKKYYMHRNIQREYPLAIVGDTVIVWVFPRCVFLLERAIRIQMGEIV